MAIDRRLQQERKLKDFKDGALNVHVALPLHGRLDALLERLEDERGIRSSRRDLVAALILAAPTNAAKLDKMIRTLNTAPASAALVAGVDDAKILEFKPPGPGRRAYRRSG